MSYAVFPSGPFETNAYLLYCPMTLEAVFIDPAPGSSKALASFIESQKLNPKGIWLTHSHWDHTADVAPLLHRYSIKPFIHADDFPNLESPGADRLPCWIEIEPVKSAHLIKENDVLSVGQLEAKVIHTPGHTPGGVCFYLAPQKLLFSGDTLFRGTIGNLSFPTARPALMWQSLAKLAKLPSDTLVLPGHGESTTLGQEPWLGRAEELFG